MRIVAPPAGALLFAALAMSNVMLVDVATAAFGIVPLLVLTLPSPPGQTRAVAGWRGVGRDVLEGISVLKRRRGHAALVGVAAAVNLWVVPAFALLPLLVLGDFDGGPGRLAAMSSSFGIGVLAGGTLLGVWGGFKKRIITAIAAIAGMGVAVLGVGLAPSAPQWPVTTAMLMMGLTFPLVNGPIQAILQATIEPGLQGRVFSTMASVAGIAVPLGLALAAAIAESFGVRSWFIGGGIVCIVMAGTMAQMPSILRIEGDPSVR